ncbi:hypothetical protein PWG14_28650 [Chromobacterium amazonense]|uniref:hypothetical protein n=1 Tax=Chromobacterium amazonense TaxID=1382803 RepID=UPI00237D6DDD|nr:hypothetical protein [Chromobacterium amazonense]MDE1716443.1 hypothetical protein [Chromobacterium amazonense]
MPITQFANVQPRQSVMLYLGDGGEPTTGKTDLLSALGQYVHRVANTNKDLSNYPLVFTEEAGLNKFHAIRNEKKDYQHFKRGLKTGDVDVDTGMQFMLAINTVRAEKAGDFNFTSDQKIYIHAHGSAGLAKLASDGRLFTMQEVAKKLEDIGVPKDLRDIRLISCDSADARPVPDLKAENLSTYGSEFVEQSQFLGFTWNKHIYKAPAQHLAEELAELGYKQVTVTGYHGKGIVTAGDSFPETSLRNPKVPSDPDFDPKATVRRSTVSQQFRSEID